MGHWERSPKETPKTNGWPTLERLSIDTVAGNPEPEILVVIWYFITLPILFRLGRLLVRAVTRR